MIPLAAALGRSERRAAATNYVQGLLMPGQRKSIEPTAARLGIDPQRLQQFMAALGRDRTVASDSPRSGAALRTH